MFDKDNELGSSNRRSFLKTAGSLTTAAVLPTGAAAASRGESRVEDVYQRSLVAREKNNWDVDQWRKFLLKNGVEFQWKDASISVPERVINGKENSDDSASTQYLNRKFLDLSVTYIIGYYTSDNLPRIDVDWTFNVTDDYPNAWGEDPADMVQIHWGDEDYNIAGDKQYYGSDCRDPSYRGVDSIGNNGMIAEWDDYGATAQYRPTDVTYDAGSYCGTALHPETSEPSDERSFSIDYKAFWDNVDLDWSFTVGYPSVSASNNTKSWVANFQALQPDLYDTKTKDYESEPGT